LHPSTISFMQRESLIARRPASEWKLFSAAALRLTLRHGKPDRLREAPTASLYLVLSYLFFVCGRPCTRTCLLGMNSHRTLFRHCGSGESSVHLHLSYDYWPGSRRAQLLDCLLALWLRQRAIFCMSKCMN